MSIPKELFTCKMIISIYNFFYYDPDGISFYFYMSQVTER